MKPRTRIKLALRAARRRYGYAALRVLRRGLVAALCDHEARTLSWTGRYDGEHEAQAIYGAYVRARRRLHRRWPWIDYADPRSVP